MEYDIMTFATKVDVSGWLRYLIP